MRADDEVAGSEDERLISLVGCIRGAVLELDGDGRYLNAWVDDPALLFAPREELLGRTVLEVLGPVVGPPLLERVLRVYRTGVSERYEYELSIHGRRCWFMSDFKRVAAKGGGYSVLLFRHDISDKKAAIEALRLSEERYRLAALATNDILYDWDVRTNLVTWGPSMKRVLGLDEPTLAAWTACIHPDDTARIDADVRRVLDSNEPSWQGGYRVRRGDGTYAEILDRGFVVRNARGKAIRVVGSLADVTQMNRLQAQLVQADRLAALGTLAAGVGHEINNPLCFVVGNLDLALEAGPFAQTDEARAEEADARLALQDARDGAARIVEIVKGLRLFSRSDATVTSDVRIENVIESSLKIAENEIRHRARLVRRFERAPSVTVNESQLGQVCLNLLVNAAQAIPPGNAEDNEIVLTTGVDDDGRAFFSVRDTGTGIPAEILGRIFDPFFTTKAPGAGTGIGLSVCMTIVQSMGGALTVASRPDEGSVFTVLLPTTSSHKARPAA